MLYKLSLIQKHHETNLTLSQKWSRSTQRHHLKKAPGHGHTTTWYKFWQCLKLLLFPSFCTSSRKSPFASLVYDILFYFIHTHVYTAQEQEETTLADNFFDEKGLITLLTGCMFQKIPLPSDFMHIFHDSIHVYI